MAETGASIYNPGGGTGTANAQIIDGNSFTLVNTTSASVLTAGSSTSFVVASSSGILVDMYLTIDSGSVAETVQVSSISGTTITLYHPVQNVHNGSSTAFPVVAKFVRQIGSLGDPTTFGNVASVGANGGLSTNVLTGAPDGNTSGTITVTDAVVAAPANDGTFRTGVSTAGSYVYLALPNSTSNWTAQITGLTSGTLYFEMSMDSTIGTDGNWIAINGRQTGILNTNLNYFSTSNGLFRGNAAGARFFRVRSVGALSGTPAIVIRAGTGEGATFMNAGLPPSSDIIGNIRIDQTNPGTTNAVQISGVTSVVPVQGYTTGAPVTGNITASGIYITASVATAGNISIQISGTYVAAFTFQMSIDGGVTWINYAGTRFDDSGCDSVTPILTNITQGWNFSGPAVTNIRVFASTYTSGTAAVRITQGSFLFTEAVAATIVQPITRQRVILSASSIVSPTAETLITFTLNRNGVLTASQTLYTVAAGRTFRLQKIYFSTRITTFNTTTVSAATNTFRIRQTSLTGNIEYQVTLQGTSNTLAAIDTSSFPDGIEYAAGSVLAMTQIGSAATLTSDFIMIGYEY